MWAPPGGTARSRRSRRPRTSSRSRAAGSTRTGSTSPQIVPGCSVNERNSSPYGPWSSTGTAHQAEASAASSAGPPGEAPDVAQRAAEHGHLVDEQRGGRHERPRDHSGVHAAAREREDQREPDRPAPAARARQTAMRREHQPRQRRVGQQRDRAAAGEDHGVRVEQVEQPGDQVRRARAPAGTARPSAARLPMRRARAAARARPAAPPRWRRRARRRRRTTAPSGTGSPRTGRSARGRDRVVELHTSATRERNSPGSADSSRRVSE